MIGQILRILYYKNRLCVCPLVRLFYFFFFFFEHRLSTLVGTPNLSMQVKIQPTYLTLGVEFCVYGAETTKAEPLTYCWYWFIYWLLYYCSTSFC